MADAELTLKIGEVELHARGPQEWVSEQFGSLAERYIAERLKRSDANQGEEGSRNDRVIESSRPPSVIRWIKQNGISKSQLDQIFDHGKDGWEIIVGNAPGNSAKDQVIAIYLFMGVRAFLETGESFFDDKATRARCNVFGCYDPKHHVENLDGMGNKLSGNKEQGWKLTAPGMLAAAELIKQISSD